MYIKFQVFKLNIPNRGTESALTELREKVLTQKAKSKKVAILALDASAAFDVLDIDLVIKSLEVIGAGSVMLKWATNYLHNCTQYVDINGTLSEQWSCDVGVGQGKPMSVDFFNLGSLSNALWTTISENILYADDGSDIIAGDTEEELNNNIKATAILRSSWFDKAGLTLNAAKSELIGFGVQPEPLVIEGSTIMPKTSFKFLGLTIDHDLKFHNHVDNIAKRMHSAAGHIRAEGRNLATNNRRILFNGWVRSILTSNGLAYLPHLCASQLQKVSAAYNAGIRAIYKLLKKCYAPIAELSKRLNIPSVEQIKDCLLFTEAWKRRHDLTKEYEGPITRGRTNLNVPLPNKSGVNGKRLSTMVCDYWNRLPIHIKRENDQVKAKREIKNMIYRS